MPSNFKDLFSAQSVDYARYRPVYPSALFDYLATTAPSRGVAWDCGTGNGQAAIALAERFDRVAATDVSDKQIGKAAPHPRISYRIAPAETSGLADSSIDCITVAQAFHWFRQEDFFTEVRRVLRSGGILAIWSYNLCRITPEVDAEVLHLYRDLLGPWWEKERALVEEGYASVTLPLQELPAPRFKMSADWTVDHLIGYLGTWSALQSCISKGGYNPLIEMEPLLRNAWGADPARTVSWELSLRICRKD